MFKYFLKLIFPDNCINCRELTDKNFCDKCLLKLKQHTEATGNKHTLCEPKGYNLQIANSAKYEHYGLLSKAIKQYKYHGRKNLVIELTDLLYQALYNQFPWLFWEVKNMLICPIPSSWLRKNKHGFDHTGLLARSLAERIGSNVWDGLKVKNLLSSKSQVGSDGIARRTRKITFLLSKKPPSGCKIILIDDVVTTGSTFKAAARCLHEYDQTLTIYALAIASRLR